MGNDLKRIRRREERGNKGPWKWQLLDALARQEKLLEAVAKALLAMTGRTETQRKLSEAGKKSAAARKAKFGSAAPGIPKVVVAGPLNLKPEQLGLGVVEPLREQVREPSRKKKSAPAESSSVWDSYSIAYLSRYRVEPLRNAKVNAQCKELVKQLGLARACLLVAYYVERNDAFYVNAKHPLGLCLLNAQKLVTEKETNTVVTMTDARRIESASQTDRAIREYVAKQEVAGK